MSCVHIADIFDSHTVAMKAWLRKVGQDALNMAKTLGIRGSGRILRNGRC